MLIKLGLRRINYNILLEKMCEKNNFNFINYWDLIVEYNQVKQEYMPINLDHHIVNNDNLIINFIKKELEKIQWDSS